MDIREELEEKIEEVEFQLDGLSPMSGVYRTISTAKAILGGVKSILKDKHLLILEDGEIGLRIDKDDIKHDELLEWQLRNDICDLVYIQDQLKQQLEGKE